MVQERHGDELARDRSHINGLENFWVYYYFNKWQNDGGFEELNDVLRNNYRKSINKAQSPSVGLIDNQSVKATRRGGLERGVDGGKKVKGRNRHIIIDTQGLLLAVKVHAAKAALEWSSLRACQRSLNE